jgi:hypothetical protein
MPSLHVSRHNVDVIKWIAEGGLVTAVALLSAITAATLIYAWFIA